MTTSGTSYDAAAVKTDNRTLCTSSQYPAAPKSNTVRRGCRRACPARGEGVPLRPSTCPLRAHHAGVLTSWLLALAQSANWHQLFFCRMTPDVERSTKRLAMFDLLYTRRRADRIGPLQPVYAAHAQVRTWHTLPLDGSAATRAAHGGEADTARFLLGPARSPPLLRSMPVLRDRRLR